MKNHTTLRKLNLAAAVTATLLVGSLSGNTHAAGAATAMLEVGATVQPNCTISTTAISFGDYDFIGTHASSGKTATGTVLTTCTKDSSPRITLGTGNNYDSTNGVRQMKRIGGADSFLAYGLYSDAEGATPWPSTGTGVATPTATGTQVSNTVYAKLPGAQNVGVGTYADSVVATVWF